MFSFLQRDLSAHGRVLFRGTIPPPLEQLSALTSTVTWKPAPASAEQLWAIEATHPLWGAADIACGRAAAPVLELMIDHTITLSDEERRLARLGESSIAIRVKTTRTQILHDRKRLLFWLKLVMDAGGVLAVDETSTLLWSQAMLEDELAHEADLDIESLYALHAVQSDTDGTRVGWLHTHGLEEVGAFDIDVLEPSPFFVANCADPIRAAAFAALEGRVSPDTPRFELAHPHGVVALVPARTFQEQATSEHRALRDADAVHNGKRAVICEPFGGLFRFRRTPRPSRFLSSLDQDGFVLPFSAAASALMGERARKTFDVFRRLVEEFDGLDLVPVVKLGYEVDGGDPDDREHLWFKVHGFSADAVDATLANAPHRVSALSEGQRAEHSLERLSDWMILSPVGSMTPRNVTAARQLRATRAIWESHIASRNREDL